MPVANQPGCGPCCAKDSQCVPASPCNQLVLGICNTNSRIDDDWSVSINGHDIGDLDFSENACGGKIWKTNTLVSSESLGLCCSGVLPDQDLPASHLQAGTNTIVLTRLTDRGLGNLGTIMLATYRFNAGSYVLCQTLINEQYITTISTPDETLTFTFELDDRFFEPPTPCPGDRLNPIEEDEPIYSGAGCLKCLPRYKCASVTFTPSAYSDACPSEFQSKLWYYCATNPSWGSAAGPEGSLGIAVELYRSPADNECSCYYRVSLAVGEDAETFEHITPEELPETLFTLTTDAGDYDVTIGSADVVANPLAIVPCSPCICTTCLPRKLLITVTGMDACDESVSQCTSTVFDCVAYETATVSMQFGDMLFDIEPTNPDEETCSLDVVISGIEARASDLRFKIMLETGPQKAPGDDCDPVSLYECRELPDVASPDSFFSQGFKSQGDCHGWMKAAMIDHTATIMSVDELTQLCTVRIQDASCADCQPVSVRCPGGCKSLDRIPVEGSMCAPPDIVATFIHESCEDIDGYTFDMSGWPGTGFGEHAFQTVSPIIVNRCSYESTNHFGAYLLDFSLPCVDHDPPEEGQCGPAYYTVEAVLVFETPECEGDLPESPMLYKLHLEISATCTAYGPNPFYTYLILSPDAETASCSPFLLDFTLPSWASLHDRIPCCDTEGSFKLRLTL